MLVCLWCGAHDLVKVTWKGEIAEDGMVINLAFADQALQCIMKHLDHKNIDDLEYFKERPSTGENICLFIWMQLQQVDFAPAEVHSVSLKETDKNKFIIYG